MRLFKFTAILFLLSIFVFSSCKKDEEENSLSIDGIWKASDEESENEVFGEQSYPIEISQINDTLFSVNNFANLGENCNVNICIKSNSINIATKKIEDYSLRGTGVIKDNAEEINITYYLDDERIISKWKR